MILVINLGLKSIRAILFGQDGKRVSTAARNINSRLSGSRVEQDANEWRDLMYVVIDEALDRLDTKDVITHVTVSCSASCLVPVDSNLNPTSRVIMVSDRRATEQGARIAAHPAFAPLARDHGFSASQYSQMARMLWLKEEEPDNFAKTHKFLSPNDFLIALLSGGAFVTDTLNAEKFFWDKTANEYPNTLYDAFELSSSLLPKAVPIGENIGQMDAKIAASLGITSRPDIIIGTYDAICSIFGTGVAAPGRVCDVSGTVTSVRMYSQKPFQDGKARVMCQYFAPSNGYLIGGSNNLGGGLIEWAKTCFYQNEPSPYDLMQSESSNETSASANHTGIIFLPHLLGARAPQWNPSARGAFFGLERHHGRGDIMRAIFESIGYSIRDFLEIFKESGTKPEMITASGGLAKIRIANEIKATITGLPYHFMEEFESTSLGAAIIVMCETGIYDSYQEACERMVVTSQIFLPRKHEQAYYQDMYELYKEFEIATNPLLTKREQIAQKHVIGEVEYVENL